jgi:hypothetical protein
LLVSGEVLGLDGDVLVLDGSVLDGCGAAVVPSLPGAVIGAVQDASGLLMPGAAGVLSSGVAVEVPAGASGCVTGGWAVPGALESGAVVVWACAAADATSAPAARTVPV